MAETLSERIEAALSNLDGATVHLRPLLFDCKARIAELQAVIHRGLYAHCGRCDEARGLLREIGETWVNGRRVVDGIPQNLGTLTRAFLAAQEPEKTIPGSRIPWSDVRPIREPEAAVQAVPAEPMIEDHAFDRGSDSGDDTDTCRAEIADYGGWPCACCQPRARHAR